MNLTGQSQINNKSDILVVYFSWSGNAKVLAEQIALEIGADLFQVTPATPYPEDYNQCIQVAREEQNKDARPAITGKVNNMDDYKTIFFCFPNWWGTLPMPMFTFLESYDFSGKTMYPLVTHGGSRFGRSLDDIKKLCPGVTVKYGLAISAFDRNPKDSTIVTHDIKELAT